MKMIGGKRRQPRWLCEGATAENTEGGRHNMAECRATIE